MQLALCAARRSAARRSSRSKHGRLLRRRTPRRERDLEASAIKRPSPTTSRRRTRSELSRETHVAGTPAQARTRDYVIAQMKKWGIETEVRAYDVWMPHPTSVKASRVSPSAEGVRARRAAGGRRSDVALAQYPTVNGYSGEGDVTADVVYVNYGLIEDYAQLDSMGVSVKGKIAIARYGRSFRGIKAREAEKHGAVGLLIYSDPQDDGFVVGRRLSRRPDAQRERRAARQHSQSRRRSVDARLRKHAGRAAPDAGQDGDLAHSRRADRLRQRERATEVRSTAPARRAAGRAGSRSAITSAPGRCKRARRRQGRSRDETDEADLSTRSASFAAASFPDELVIIGGHRDGWGPGAADNVSGTVSVLEAARAIAEEVKSRLAAEAHDRLRDVGRRRVGVDRLDGIRRRRFAAPQSQNAVAYFNQDVAAQGPRFGGGGSPSLRADAARRRARRSRSEREGQRVLASGARRARSPDTAEPAMGDPGGGSDFAGFYNHLGIPIAEWGFGGAGGVYHSQYDSYAWMTKFGDPELRVSRRGGARRDGDAAAHRERRRAAVRLRRVRAHDAALPRADRSARSAEHHWNAPTTRAARGDRSARARRRSRSTPRATRRSRAAVPNADAAAHEPRADAGRARAACARRGCGRGRGSAT